MIMAVASEWSFLISLLTTIIPGFLLLTFILFYVPAKSVVQYDKYGLTTDAVKSMSIYIIIGYIVFMLFSYMIYFSKEGAINFLIDKNWEVGFLWFFVLLYFSSFLYSQYLRHVLFKKKKYKNHKKIAYALAFIMLILLFTSSFLNAGPVGDIVNEFHYTTSKIEEIDSDIPLEDKNIEIDKYRRDFINVLYPNAALIFVNFVISVFSISCLYTIAYLIDLRICTLYGSEIVILKDNNDSKKCTVIKGYMISDNNNMIVFKLEKDGQVMFINKNNIHSIV